ncbi:unnamed protein product [Litomosoides sigmodontis]|uniref:MHD domain-containing protein n=1 Tax=Litomosoides sigmodontis TaxID=42156 RepID=A0A3P6TWK6_LITSI|nr:unnamed protein product [Litomosoides sigmodontis]
MASEMTSFVTQANSDEQKVTPEVMECFGDAPNGRQTFAHHSNMYGMNESGSTSLTQAISARYANFEPNEEGVTERQKSTTSNASNMEREESRTILETQSTVINDTSSSYVNAERYIADATETIDFRQTDNTSYQQAMEYEQYMYSYDEPPAQSYETQNINYVYGSTPYQGDAQQQQSEAPVNYQNCDQMNYATEYQRYDQQSTITQEKDYGQQSAELYGYGTSQYNQSQEYGYNDYNAYTSPSSYMPSANDQNYSNQTEFYTGNPEERSNDYDVQYNEQYAAENPVLSTYANDAYRPAVILPYTTPSGPDPFSWEAQESGVGGVMATEQMPQPARELSQSETHQQNEMPTESERDVESSEEVKRKPPLRPAPPSPSVQRSAPARPPMLSLSSNLKQSIESSSLHQQPTSKLAESEEAEENAWAQFKKLTDKATMAVKSTEERLKELEKTTAAKDIKDESYLAQIGGSQAYVPEMAYKQARAQSFIPSVNEKKAKHGKSKKMPEPELTLEQEDDMDRAAMELAKKMAATRIDLQDWRPPLEQKDLSTPVEESKEFSAESTMLEGKSTDDSADVSNIPNKATPFSEEPRKSTWTGFNDAQPAELPPSESGFFINASVAPVSPDDAFGDPIAECDNNSSVDRDYDPFNVCSADELMNEAKARVAAVIAGEKTKADASFSPTSKINDETSDVSSTTQEGDNETSSRPLGFDDEFRADDDAISTPSPLYDEDDNEPLTEFPLKFAGDGWEMMIRYPIKKKIMSDRYWKPCYVRLRDNSLFMFNSKSEQKPFMEILLQATHSLSDPTLQAYDVYGKIHTVKLQYVSYKERVGIRPGQISRLVEGHVTKYGLPLEHSAQCTVLLKFGSLNAAELFTFVATVEDVLFRCVAVRNSTPQYKQDEVQIHCYDEYAAYVDKFNALSDQRARVRLFCLAFVSGSPILEIGLNDRRRQGKEIVRRKDILPMYTERWIRFENLEFHNTVEQDAFEREQVIRLSPPDGCFFEVMRFRVRPPKNREKPLTVKCVMKIAGSKVEIRIEAMAAAQTEKARGALSSKRQVPCEDIQIRFPVPEAWIYLFREERRWGVGSVHAKVRRPGKVKNLKDRLMGTVHNVDNSLIEAGIGEAKYEHVFRALVWRIPRLPEKYHAAYREHLLRCRFELSSFDLMPETFTPTCDVEFTMPLAMVSNTVVRSVSVEQHEDSDRVEKFVRYVAKCTYKVEIDYVQCSDLDMEAEAMFDPTAAPNPTDNQESVAEQRHKAMFDPDEVKQLHGGYRIDFSDAEIGAKKQDNVGSSSEEEEEEKNRRPAMPIIQIDPKNYEY